MAIVKMKKIHVVAMADQKEDLLRELLHLGCVEIIEPEEGDSDSAWPQLLERESSGLVSTKTEMAQVDSALRAIQKYAGIKERRLVKRRLITEEEFLSSSSIHDARAAVREIGEQLRKLVQLQGEETHLLQRKAEMEPWKALNLPLEQTETEHVLFRFLVSSSSVELREGKLRLADADAAAELLEIGVDPIQRYTLLICHRDEEEDALELLRLKGFRVTYFRGMSGTPEENIHRIEQELTENQAQQKRIQTTIAAFQELWETLHLYADRLTAEADQEASRERLLTDGTILCFDGWVPAEKLNAVERLMERMDCAWAAEDPQESEYPNVPIQLKNNWFSRPLNLVTEMYSLPVYDNVDPNPLMAPFFIFFYGIMMADMGYGILMMLTGFLISKKFRPTGTTGHMVHLAGLCGISTFVMGALTGSFFGDFLSQIIKLSSGKEFALPALFTPLGDTVAILVGCMALGFFQILVGMLIGFLQKIRHGRVMDAIWEELTWWVVFAGIACTVTGGTKAVLFLGLGMVLIGAGWNAKGFGKIMAVFASLYHHVTGYFGDILSYSRLMALMLAGSVIAQVFNTLGAIPGNLVIFLGISLLGNALNFALNLLGCYVHDLRLQCLEYFGKFYQDGGKPFRPLAFHTKYVEIETR